MHIGIVFDFFTCTPIGQLGECQVDHHGSRAVAILSNLFLKRSRQILFDQMIKKDRGGQVGNDRTMDLHVFIVFQLDSGSRVVSNDHSLGRGRAAQFAPQVPKEGGERVNHHMCTAFAKHHAVHLSSHAL